MVHKRTSSLNASDTSVNCAAWSKWYLYGVTNYTRKKPDSQSKNRKATKQIVTRQSIHGGVIFSCRSIQVQILRVQKCVSTRNQLFNECDNFVSLPHDKNTRYHRKPTKYFQ